MARFGIDGPEAGLALLDEVHRIVDGSSAPLLGAIAHIQAGAINVMSSNWSEALAELAQVEPHLDDLTPPERCATLINRGLAHLSLQQLTEGRADLEAALTIAVDHDLRMEEFKARHNLGCVAFIAGDLPAALRLMAEAAALDAGVGLARAHLDHAKVLLDAGLVDEAEVVLDLGLDAAHEDRQPLERGDIQIDLARAALLRGDLAQARTWAGRAARTFRTLHATGRADEAELIGAAIDVGIGSRLARAGAVADRWDSPIATQPNERLATRIRAEVALGRHDLAVAQQELDRLDTSAVVPLGAFLHERLLAARIAAADGDPARSKALIAGAAERLARDQGSVHSHEVRAGLALHAARIRDADVEMATDSGSLSELFDATERWRAASLRAAPISPPDDPEVGALVGRLRQLRRDSQPSAAAVTADRDLEASRLQAEITERLRRTVGPTGPRGLRAATLDEASALVGSRRATVITFHEVRGTVVRVVVGPDTTQSVIGPVAEVVAASSRAIADGRALALARPTMTRFLAQARASSLRRVDELLLGGLSATGTVVIVPTVGLASLPWRALPSLAGHPVVASPSVTAWAQRSTPETHFRGVVALPGPGLPRSREEAQAVTKVWGRHTESASATTPSAYAVSSDVREALASASVVHLAAHGHHVDQSPLFSSLDMADGPVFAHELRAPLAAELVILSACDVGRSRGRVGDEPLGLAAALLSLGVQCAVAATNPVHDDVAAAAMIALHKRLVDGVDVATALRDTAIEVEGADAFCAYGNTWSRPQLANSSPPGR
ncbi:CHAT domain-containing protein [Knoellia subterranea]|uniref:CHAT domain-containing protein n=1 Tax=Knoellia subterranea KCTC 19937 TaxID=1385521 RepID=A0A0A0JKJ9_9MICO|nr:CHAT domain-containing protein [Knoellia subterranea]KGN37299.1 hypothetical protein N803_15340 [Knoellia subterranea KCTC 19937]